jgi:hypothetical protein
MSWTDKLVEMDACEEAVWWARGYASPQAAWAACERGDWMLWLAGRLAGEPHSAARKRLVLAACACVRLALEYVPRGEARPRTAVETAERWARDEGGVTLQDVRAAAAAAYAAAAAAAAAYASASAARIAMLARCATVVRDCYPTPPRLCERRYKGV